MNRVISYHMDDAFALVPDGSGWRLEMAGVAHSWVDLDDPWRLEFGYMERIADYLDNCWPEGERMRVVHIGGGALSLPRYLAATRPTSPQIVLEPNAALIAEVRAKLPLEAHSGVKVRLVDGRTGLGQMRSGYARVIIVDAFADARVPAELVSAEFAAELARVLVDEGIVVFNLIDINPLAWSKRVVATLASVFRYLALSAEPAVWKGRRHGNLVLAASRAPLPLDAVNRRAASSFFPYRIVHGAALTAFCGGARGFTDADAESSPIVERGLLHFE